MRFLVTMPYRPSDKRFEPVCGFRKRLQSPAQRSKLWLKIEERV